ncbi:hypothetical protein EMCRGX_G014899 [Ephydatia muelleri]|eukprot:Em0005g1064a
MAFSESRAIQAFSKHQDALSAAMGDPMPVAIQLLSRNLISRTAKDRACHPTKALINRKAGLMAGIRERLSDDPSAFTTLLSVLREWPELVLVCDQLQAEVMSDATHVVDETSTLTPKHLVKLYILLEGVAHLWYSIGLAVGMSESNLTKLKQECWKDKTCLWEVLKVWVEGESPNLEQLAKGLSMIADCSTLVSSINATTLGAGFNKHWLHPKNLSILHSTLLPLSPRWKELGHELGFLESELMPIEDHRGLDTPDQQLQQLLRQWLAWAPPKHPLPFSEEILAALIQLGETDMASRLERVMFGSEGVRDQSKGSECLHLLPSHLPALFGHLEGLSPKWRDIGIKLGFSVQEIKKIERGNGLFETKHHLQELLRRWLEWAPPLHCSPQVQDLSRVLCSLGEEARVFKIEQDATLLASPVLTRYRKLHPSHLDTLTSTLTPLSPRWKDLATQLGFVHSDLRSIEHSRGLFRDDQYLREMLKRWLSWGPPKPSVATVEAITSALETLGEYPLSEAVKDTYTHQEKETVDTGSDMEFREFKKCPPYS